MSGTAVKTREREKIDTAPLAPIAPVQPDEYMVQCPECKTLETIFVVNGEMISNRRFYTEDGHIYHACGTDRPCRLFKNT